MGEGVVIVTGGSGGIGAAVALRLAGEGARVCISYLANEAKARETMERAPAGSMIAVRADLGREEDIAALFGEVDRKLGRLTGLVNNAAVIGVESRVDSVRAEDLAALWATNITG